MKKKGNYLLMALMAMLLGAIAGAIVWAILRIINLGTELIWHRNGLVYNLIVCMIGALLIGFWQKKYGILPEETEEVMERIKTQGTYPRNRMKKWRKGDLVYDCRSFGGAETKTG